MFNSGMWLTVKDSDMAADENVQRRWKFNMWDTYQKSLQTGPLLSGEFE
jgi:hypothetical protein